MLIAVIKDISACGFLKTMFGGGDWFPSLTAGLEISIAHCQCKDMMVLHS